MTTTAREVVIPFRDRGDPLRRANLERVLDHWNDVHEVSPLVVSDGREGDAQFCRSAAYNRAAELLDTRVFVFAEADMLIPPLQLDEAVARACAQRGLVVPFDQYRYLSAQDSRKVREGAHPHLFEPERVIDHGRSIGAINVVSRATLDSVGRWDESFEGSWFDDNAMKIAFDICAGPTRTVVGPAYHLYHLPGWTGDHLTPADRQATARNRARYDLYQQATTPEQIRSLTAKP